MIAEKTQIACFMVDGSIYGVDIMDIKEVIRCQKILSIPKALDFVEGVINLREEAIPVISMRKRFGLELIAEDKSTRIVILKVDAKEVGLVVDSVDKVLTIEEADLKSAPDAKTVVEADYLSGVVWDGEDMVMILNIEKILSGEEKITLAEISGEAEENISALEEDGI